MNENLNLVEILKDCPKGIELYSPMYGIGILTKVTNRIHVKFPKEHNVKCFRPDGKVSEDGEIMLFPKGKTTWEEFKRPFVDGDIIFRKQIIEGFKFHNIGIYKSLSTSAATNDMTLYCQLNADNELYTLQHEVVYNNVWRLATEKEKQKLFKAIQENGYKWNAETKTLEKLISNKFDPKTLQPFDKVLVSSNDEWFCDFFSHYDNDVIDYNCICTGGCPYECCIPYNDDTKHLIGKSIEEAPEFYRYWEE